jgi:hypothetical protein
MSCVVLFLKQSKEMVHEALRWRFDFRVFGLRRAGAGAGHLSGAVCGTGRLLRSSTDDF